MASVVGFGTWTEKTGSGTSQTLPLPAGCQVGDHAYAGWTVNSATVVSTQTGFTTKASFGSTGSTLVPSVWMGRRTLTQTDLDNGFVTLNSIPSAVGSGGVIVARGFLTTDDFTVVQQDKTSTASGQFPFGAQTLTLPGVLCIYVIAQNAVQTGTFTPATSFTETGDRSAGRNATMGYRVMPSSGSSGAITPTSTDTNRGVGILVGARPPATASGGNFMPFLTD